MNAVNVALGLAQFAPSLMRYFGAGEQPVAVAQQAVEIARAVTGAADGPAALDQLRADPQLAQRYAQAALEHEGALERAYLADRADARARDVAYLRAGLRNRRADVMVLLDVVGLVACLLAIVWLRESLSGEAITLITTLASYFGLSLRDAHQFEFGSSRGSRQKDEFLATLKGGQ